MARVDDSGGHCREDQPSCDGCGENTNFLLQVDEAGPSLRNATAKVTKATRTGNGQSGGEGEASGSYSDEPPF